MNNRKPEPVTQRDHPYASWSSAELDWIAKRDAQWAAWGYSLAPLTPAPEPVRERAAWWPMSVRVRNCVKRAVEWLRFGDIRAETRSVDGGVASEIAFIGRGGKTVGYWAYGSFDPSFPYRG